MKQVTCCLLLTIILFSSCAHKEKADLLVYNATIYTVDDRFSTTEAMVIRGGKILATGTTADLENKYDCTLKEDAGGKFIYPGFIDAHAHFVGYANSLQRVNLVGTTSWEELVTRTQQFAAENPTGWVLGRGWDQNDWAQKQFPSNEKLNELFPDRPVLLSRIDGHAAIANQKALELAGLKPGQTISGGEIETRNGKLTGILVDNAVSLVANQAPPPGDAALLKALQAAEKNCFEVGLTTIDDCGLPDTTIEKIRQWQNAGELKMRLYIMLSDEKRNYEFAKKNGMIKTPYLNVRSFKVYGDGALGSRGACLLAPYSDQPGHYGFLLSDPAHFDSVARVIDQLGWQMCTHAIGDSGNRTILHIYAKYLKGNNDRRWRIEHAQVINAADFKLFGENNIIPSVQPTHATSDMPWAATRLGADRVKGAYAYAQLLAQNKWIPLGTDFPVEDISPFKTFYAAVVRKDGEGSPAAGFQMENALTREQALRGMTGWAAKANFEETEKGSLEKGKLADFVILDHDLMKEAPEKLLQVKVIATYSGGVRMYRKP